LIAQKYSMAIKHQHIYMCFRIETNEQKRRVCFDTMTDKSIQNQNICEYEKYLKLLSTFQFAICPEGNGLDTHRFWECLYLKTIPICLRNEITIYYQQFFPMVLLDNWSELDPVQLKYDDFQWNSDSDLLLRMDYWKQPFSTHVCHGTDLLYRKQFMIQQFYNEQISNVVYVTKYDNPLTDSCIDTYFDETAESWQRKLVKCTSNIEFRMLRQDERTLCLKHYCALTSIAQGIFSYGVILENNAALRPRFTETLSLDILQLPTDWDVFFINTYDGLFGESVINRFEKKSTGAYSLSYVITRTAAQRLIAFFDTHKFTLPFDFECNNSYSELGFNVYWRKDALVVNAGI